MELLLQILINKIDLGELKLYSENYKRVYVEINTIDCFEGFKVIKNKCVIKPYKHSIEGEYKKLFEENGWSISIIGTYDGKHEIERKFTTFLNNTHTGYGNTIIAEGWNCTPYLNIDNKGNDIILPKKELIIKFKSPQSI